MWKPTISSDEIIMHSAKGTSWIKKNHKYKYKKDGKYYYYDSDKVKERRRKNAEKERRKLNDRNLEAGIKAGRQRRNERINHEIVNNLRKIALYYALDAIDKKVNG